MRGLRPPGPFLRAGFPVPVAPGGFAVTELMLLLRFPEGYIRHGELLEEGREPREGLALCSGVVLPKWQPEHESSGGSPEAVVLGGHGSVLSLPAVCQGREP